MIPDERLQELIARKNPEEALKWCEQHGYGESWTIIDQALVIYDFEDPPDWFKSVLNAQDEDGNTTPERIQLERIKLEGPCEERDAQLEANQLYNRDQEKEARSKKRVDREREASLEAAGVEES